MADKLQQYVLMPPRSLRAETFALSEAAAPFLARLGAPSTVLKPIFGEGGPAVRVLDSINTTGAKLIEADADGLAAVRMAQPELLIAPVVYYSPALVSRPSAIAVAAPSPAATRVEVQVRDAQTGQPVAGADVVAFVNVVTGTGAGGTTDAQGRVRLSFAVAPTRFDLLAVHPPLAGYWGARRRNVPIAATLAVNLEPIAPDFTDCLRHFYGEGEQADGAGVTVGIVDTGVGPHPDLVCQGDIDNGAGHGSHVAGIIAGRGRPRGVAPAASLRSYRVFSQPGSLSANFTIAKAIDQAVQDGCDLINLSLKIDNQSNPSGFAIDPVVQAALEDARAVGVLPIAAAGNDDRTAVDFPGRDPMCLAVTALGRRGTFPASVPEEAFVAQPFATDPLNFVASFSNGGLEVDLTAPGVAVISTVPGGYGVMSGTSMACPAAVGVAARMLGADAALLKMPRTAARSAEIARRMLQRAARLGFPRALEGHGLAQ